MESANKKLRLPSTNNNRDILRYAGLGTQLLVAIGVAVFVGLKADKWLHTLPLFSCALPLLVLIGIFYKLIRETTIRRRTPKQTGSSAATDNKKENDSE
jgi:F0F1-type ATP synthase assembly protein I